MATLRIRNIDETTLKRLHQRAAIHGRSVDEEAHVILKTAVNGITGPELWQLSRDLFGGEHGIDLELPPRKG